MFVELIMMAAYGCEALVYGCEALAYGCEALAYGCEALAYGCEAFTKFLVDCMPAFSVT